MKRLLLALWLCCLVFTSAWAEETPPKGGYDPRVRVVNYNRLEVVKLTTFYGVSTHVQFGEFETIKDVAFGDELAWEAKPRGRNLYIKPKAENADTNLTVVTDRRTYHFALVLAKRSLKDATAWRDPQLVFSVYFRYPEEEAAKNAAIAKQAALKARMDGIKEKLNDAKKEGQNFDYWAAGSLEVSPTGARDDGRFTYLTFSNNRDMPAVYAVDSQGNESLINTNVDGNTIIVHRVLPRMTLRKGNYVVCIVNKSFDLDSGTDNNTGTIAPDVKRVITGGPQQ